MNLIEQYIQEVTRRLPEHQREDIALELQSTIEDMLPDDFSDQDVKSVLSKLGNPAILASGYLDRPMHLIGPRYFDIYKHLLKMILPIGIVISVISVIADHIVSYAGDEAVLNIILVMIGEGIWRLLSTSIQVFFWLTLFFAILERTDHSKKQVPLTHSFKEWTPEDLENVTYIPKEKAISRIEVFGSLLWTAAWATIYFNASKLVGVYENRGEGLVFVTPTFNHEILISYWPLVIIVLCLELTSAIYKWITAQWTKKVAIVNTVFHFVSTVVFIIILSNPNLFTVSFTTYITELFTITDDLKNWFSWGAIFTFILFAVIDSFQGFKKARIQTKIR